MLLAVRQLRFTQHTKEKAANFAGQFYFPPKLLNKKWKSQQGDTCVFHEIPSVTLSAAKNIHWQSPGKAQSHTIPWESSTGQLPSSAPGWNPLQVSGNRSKVRKKGSPSAGGFWARKQADQQSSAKLGLVGKGFQHFLAIASSRSRDKIPLTTPAHKHCQVL